MSVRPTKKQKALLDFIDKFIGEHGYSPSYREIMTSLNYNSVATVALHVNSLINRGHLRKRDHAARSLEVVATADDKPTITIKAITGNQQKWLIEQIEHHFATVETAPTADPAALDNLYVLVGALKVLGLDGAVQSFLPRLTTLKKRYTSQ